MKKGDKQFDVGYGQGGGGGMGGAYKGPTGSGGGGGSLPKPPPLPRKGADIDEITFNSMKRYDEARGAVRNYLKSLESYKIPESAIGRAATRKDSYGIDKPMGAVAIGMGAAAGAGVVAKKRKDAEKMEAYKRKPRMADAPPKINPRKAYED